ncbi:MAG: hypothetical protein LBF80_04920 [Spirochaetaceae bacterium]|nr:hypothetical protein [Spirochaetaceae bacterium]
MSTSSTIAAYKISFVERNEIVKGAAAVNSNFTFIVFPLKKCPQISQINAENEG